MSEEARAVVRGVHFPEAPSLGQRRVVRGESERGDGHDVLASARTKRTVVRPRGRSTVAASFARRVASPSRSASAQFAPRLGRCFWTVERPLLATALATAYAGADNPHSFK